MLLPNSKLAMNVLAVVVVAELTHFALPDTAGEFTLEGFMKQLSPNSTQLDVELNSTEALPLLYCNVRCNGTMAIQMIPRECETSSPRCRTCRCDEDCGTYGDCCPNESGDVSQSGGSEFRCIGESTDVSTIFGYYMLTSCPGELSHDPVQPYNIAPVTSRDSHVTYLNERIADCHNVTDVAHWIIEEECHNATNGTECSMSVVTPGNVTTRECSLEWESVDVIDRCNVTGLWDGVFPGPEVADMCLLWHHFPVSTYSTVFKNIYCYMCNGFVPEACLIKYRSQTRFSINIPVRLFNDMTARECTKSQWFDPIKEQCLWLACRYGYRLEDQTCVLTNTSLSDIQYNLIVDLWPDHDHRSDPLLQDWPSVQQMTLSHIKKALVLANVSYYYAYLDLSMPTPVDYDNLTTEYPTIGIKLTFRINSTCCRAELERHMDTVLQTWTMTHDGSEFNFTVSMKDYYYYYMSKTEKYLLTASGVWERNVQTIFSDNLPSPEKIIHLFPVYPTCSYINLYGDYVVCNTSTSIRLTYANITIDSKDFIEVTEGFRVICLDTLKEIYEKYELPVDSVGFAAEVLSTTLSVLSMVCLTLTFVSFCAFPSLRNLPTKNTMCLVVFLFLAQLLLQFGDMAWSNRTLCRIVGVLLHYFWMCVIFWMNVCSYHMFSVFVLEATKPVTLGSQKRLLKYALYANGLPLVIVLLTICVSLATSSGSSIGYGPTRCYLSTPLLIGLCFVLPLGVILILNAVFFGITIWTMAKVKKMSVSVGREQSHIHIYVKLSTLTGMFWILAIVAENVQVQVLVFMSIILNASQGMFIFMSYTANRRVYQLWRGKLSTQNYALNSNETKSTTV